MVYKVLELFLDIDFSPFQVWNHVPHLVVVPKPQNHAVFCPMTVCGLIEKFQSSRDRTRG